MTTSSKGHVIALPVAVGLAEFARAVPGSRPGDRPALVRGANTMFQSLPIRSRRGAAVVLAQLAHESGSFRYAVELADGSAYEPGRPVAVRLGNTEPGDGARYKGRGPVQLTGRANYAAAGKALGLPLLEQPELAADPVHSWSVATWFWRSRDLVWPTEAGDMQRVTRLINGGSNGIADRMARYAVACAALGVTA